MTTKTSTLIYKGQALECFPEFPPRDDMQNWMHLHKTGALLALHIHYEDDPNVTVASEVPIAPTLDPWGDYRIPDVSVMKDGDDDLMESQGGYAIDRQGKAPDFVLEVASKNTGVKDYTDKRDDYERYGVREYWRFDATGGEWHDAPLAADRLVDGRYEPVEMERTSAGLRGYSDLLGLYLCWEDGELRFFDPITGTYLPTHSDERQARIAAERRAQAADKRVRDLEAENRRLRGEG